MQQAQRHLPVTAPCVAHARMRRHLAWQQCNSRQLASHAPLRQGAATPPRFQREAERMLPVDLQTAAPHSVKTGCPSRITHMPPNLLDGLHAKSSLFVKKLTITPQRSSPTGPPPAPTAPRHPPHPHHHPPRHQSPSRRRPRRRPHCCCCCCQCPI